MDGHPMRNVASNKGVMRTVVSTRGSLCRVFDGTVRERVVFGLFGLAFERKQMPRFVGNASS